MSDGSKLSPGVLALVPLLVVAAILAGCGEWEAEDGDGWVLMVPRVDEEAGIRGLWPAELPDGAHFVAVSLPIPREEFVKLAMAETDLYAYPERVSGYEGDWLQWDVYSFHARLNDLGPEIMRVDLALATVDAGGEPVTYYIGFAALPEVYYAHTAEFEALFLHALDAAAPLE